MKRNLSFLFVLCASFAAQAQFAQFPSDATKFLSGANTWLVPGTLGATTVTTLGVTGAQTNSSTLGLAGVLTVGAGTVEAMATLTAASAGTNYGINVATASAGFINMTTNVGITGFTNMAAGVRYRLLIVNASAADFQITVPATVFGSWDTGGVSFPTILTNNTAATIDFFGYGTTTNAVMRFTRYVK